MMRYTNSRFAYLGLFRPTVWKSTDCNLQFAAVIEVKEDFYLYKAGVYSYSLPADYMSSYERDQHFHSVSILG